MHLHTIRNLLGLVLLTTLLCTTVAASNPSLQASLIEAKDSLLSLPITEKLTAEIRSETATMIYRESDVGRADARPVAIQLQGDVLVQVGGVHLASNWMLFNSADRSLTAAEVTLIDSGTRQPISYSCNGGQLFINGQGTGTYPTDSNPRRDVVRGAAVSCNGNMTRTVFIER